MARGISRIISILKSDELSGSLAIALWNCVGFYVREILKPRGFHSLLFGQADTLFLLNMSVTIHTSFSLAAITIPEVFYCLDGLHLVCAKCQCQSGVNKIINRLQKYVRSLHFQYSGIHIHLELMS